MVTIRATPGVLGPKSFVRNPLLFDSIRKVVPRRSSVSLNGLVASIEMLGLSLYWM